MKLLAKYAEKKIDSSNIIQIAEEAKQAKALNSAVINATIGMLFSESEEFYTFKCVKDVEKQISDTDKYAYTNTKGIKPFLDGVKKWIFQDELHYLEENLAIDIMSTPGGSGAISNTFGNYLNINDSVLLPDYMWNNYKQVAYENHLDWTTYNLFTEDGTFNIQSFKEKCLELKNKQGRILAVINDPCHNPTGYSMTYQEWKSLIDVINEITNDNTPFVLLHDLAYIDYDNRGLEETRKNFRLLTKLNSSVLTIMAFSGSKTLGLYGLRIGAMLGISKSKEVIIDFINANQFSARTKYSMSSTLGMNIIGNIFNDEKYLLSFKNELDVVRKMLIKRTELFIKEADYINLEILPFKCGFFVTIPCAKPNEVFEYLKARNVYIVPMVNAIRVAICSVNLENIRKLPQMIKEAIANVK